MSKMPREPIGDRIKQLRFQKQLTQQDLADVTGVSRMTIGAYERGTASPSLDFLSKVSERYNVTLDWLCGYSEYRESKGVNNFADAMQYLFEIDEKYHINIDIESRPYDSTHIFMEFTPMSFSNENTRRYYPEMSIDNYEVTDDSKEYEDAMRNEKIKTVIEDWKKMKELYETGVIDNEVYSLWKEKTLRYASEF